MNSSCTPIATGSLQPSGTKQITLMRRITHTAVLQADVTETPIPYRQDTQILPFVSTVTPTHTILIPSPIPTLPEATAQAKIDNLLMFNANCKLPCWWGIKPGQSHSVDVSQVLDPLSGTRKVLPTGWWYFFPNPQNDTYINQHLIFTDDIVNLIEVTFGGAKFLNLSEFLNEFGPPSEIYIRTFSNEYQGITPFYLLLYYENQGILARFESDEAFLTPNTVKVCFKQEPVWGVVLWQPVNKKSYWEVAEIANTVGMGKSKDDHLPLFTIEDFTVININSFYSTFKDANTQSCLETPRDLWPGQFE